MMPRILVVDDNPLNLELASYMLIADGLAVATASDAESAIAQVRAFDPHLVLMDVQMPQTDGLEATRRLRADPAHAGLVIVAFTAYAMKGDEARMLAAGCDGYIAKPIDVASFVATVRSHLPPGLGAADPA